MAAIAQEDQTRARAEAQAYAMIQVRINGVAFPVEVHVGSLRACLGLPSFNLNPVFRQPSNGPPLHSNMEDIDHQESEGEYGRDDADHDIEARATGDGRDDSSDYDTESMENAPTQLEPLPRRKPKSGTTTVRI